MAMSMFLKQNPFETKKNMDNLSIVMKNMLPNFQVATWDFAAVVESPVYVDKTLFIKAFFDNKDKEILITAPHGFGKSMMLDMFKTFLEIEVDLNGVAKNKTSTCNYQLFKKNNLLITQHQHFFQQHFGAYPVIRISFEYITAQIFSHIVDEFKLIVNVTFCEHNYLLKSNRLNKLEKKKFNKYCKIRHDKNATDYEIYNSLKFLSRCLYKHFNKKVFVLIDDYDAFIHENIFEDMVPFHKINSLFSNIFSSTFAKNPYIDRVLVTGLLYFKGIGSPGLGKIQKYVFLNENPFFEFFGLTEPELNHLYQRLNIMKLIKMQIQSHYDGYININKIKLYPIWAVIQFLVKKELSIYWKKPKIINKLNKALCFPFVTYTINKLLTMHPSGFDMLEKVKLEDVLKLRQIFFGKDYLKTSQFEVIDICFSILFQVGYFSYQKQAVKKQKNICAIKAPNEEMRLKLLYEVSGYFKCYSESGETCSIILNEITANPQDIIFDCFIAKFTEYVSFVNIKKNDNILVYYNLLLLVLSKTKFSLNIEFKFEEKPVLIAYKDNVGVVVKIHKRQTSEVALQQIIEQYVNFFDEKQRFKNVKDKIYIGMNVNLSSKINLDVLVNCVDLSKAKHF